MNITFTTDGTKAALNVGQAVAARSKALTGAEERIITINDGVLSRMLGTPDDVGRSNGLRLDVEGLVLVDVSDRRTTTARFVYAHDD